MCQTTNNSNEPIYGRHELIDDYLNFSLINKANPSRIIGTGSLKKFLAFAKYLEILQIPTNTNVRVLRRLLFQFDLDIILFTNGISRQPVRKNIFNFSAKYIKYIIDKNARAFFGRLRVFN